MRLAGSVRRGHAARGGGRRRPAGGGRGGAPGADRGGARRGRADDPPRQLHARRRCATAVAQHRAAACRSRSRAGSGSTTCAPTPRRARTTSRSAPSPTPPPPWTSRSRSSRPERRRRSPAALLAAARRRAVARAHRAPATRVASTNDVLKERARAGAPEWTVVLADAQTAGRGRQGRAWVSPPGNLLPLRAAAAARPTAARGRCCRSRPASRWRRRSARSGVGARLKWPNDVVVGGRKIGGHPGRGVVRRRTASSASWSASASTWRSTPDAPRRTRCARRVTSPGATAAARRR